MQTDAPPGQVGGLERYADVHVVMEPFPTVSYRSALTVYEESLIRGQLVGRGWNGAGFINPESVRLDPTIHPMPQAFWIELDGQLLGSHWEWGGFQDEVRAGTLYVTVALKHAVRPVEVRVHTALDGTPVLTRWLEITNLDDAPAALAAAYPFSGVLQTVVLGDLDGAVRGDDLYSVGLMQDSRFLHEGAFAWHRLPPAGYRIDGRYRRGRHRHPFFVLRNDATGEHYIGQLAWSGGYTFEFDLDADWQTDPRAARSTARLFFRGGPDAPAPLRVLAPGETVTTPELHLGLVMGDLDAAVQAMHDHLRRSVLLPHPEGRAGLVQSGIGPEQEMTPEAIFHEMETAAAVGAEVFFLDASWYANVSSDWYATVGDWAVAERYPEGLAPFRRRAHELGMLFGLWMEPERLGSKSRMAAERPDWLQRRYDGEVRPAGDLDLTRPAVAQWVEEQISRLIAAHELDFFRLDFNVGSTGAGFQTVREGFVENNAWRYYEAIYGIFARLRRRFPHVIFENCASGGGRTDVGMVRFFNHTWVTDWQIAPRAFSITNGMTMALPPERIDRLFGMGQNGHTRGDVDFQARLLLFVHPTIAWLNPCGSRPNPLQRGRVQHLVELYKRLVRPMHRESRIYHHTPCVVGDPASASSAWGVLELAAADRSRAIAGVFRLSGIGEPEYLFRPRGLDLSQQYRLTSDNAEQTCVIDGFSLMTRGVPVRLEAALTSELLLFEAIS